MATSAKRPRRLLDAYRFPGFSSAGDGQGRVWRPQGARGDARSAGERTVCGCCGRRQSGWYDRKSRRVRDLSCGDTRVWLVFEVRRVDCRACGAVKTGKLDWLADNPFYTKRFAWHVGRRCRGASIRDVAKELRLDWQTVKALDKQYMAEQLKHAGLPGPKAIGIDEISIRRGHTYRIVVSDLIRKRPIWFGGTDRSEASMAMFHEALGARKSAGIRAVMDMWKPFRHATQAHAPPAAILFDKFHIMAHLGKALDAVRKAEYVRLSGKDRRYIKGQKYTLLSHRENLSLDGKAALKQLLTANKRLHTALSAQGRLRPAVGLPARRLGAASLRPLAQIAALAAAQTVREICRTDRTALARHRCPLSSRKQGLARLR